MSPPPQGLDAQARVVLSRSRSDRSAIEACDAAEPLATATIEFAAECDTRLGVAWRHWMQAPLQVDVFKCQPELRLTPSQLAAPFNVGSSSRD